MAAAYQSGTASDPTDLQNKIATFLTGQGWTIDSNIADGAGKRLHAHKGSDYVNMRSAINEAVWPNLAGSAGYGVNLYMGTGYNGANAWSLQAGGPVKSGGSDTVGSCMELGSGAISAYHFFDDGSDNIVVVVERSGGIFTHIGFGRTFGKSGTWTGGAYFFGAKAGKYLPQTGIMGDSGNSAAAPLSISQPYGTNSSSQRGFAAFVRVDVDSFTGKWVGFSSSDTTAPNDGYTGKLGHSGADYNTLQENVPVGLPTLARLVLHLVSVFNNQAVLLPIRGYVQRDAGGWSHIGQLPNVFYCGAVEQGGYAAASIYTVNGKNFLLFPHFAVRKFA
jgi:hypothetical protein